MKWDALSFGLGDIHCNAKHDITIIICSAVGFFSESFFFPLLKMEVIVCITMEMHCEWVCFFSLLQCVRPVKTMPLYLTNYCRRTFVPLQHIHTHIQSNSWCRSHFEILEKKNAMPFDMNFAYDFTSKWYSNSFGAYIRRYKRRRIKCFVNSEGEVVRCVDKIEMRREWKEHRMKTSAWAESEDDIACG